ncbi:MAG: type II toxin-antitoxin system VapC family toxin [Candidatus Poribacteria bacterium]|nr:type II toxin-antitoxin system VapC family toxin [Candidatus Poribacteria bacterium]
MYYFYYDASALVKRYLLEIGSNKVNFLFANTSLGYFRCLAIGAAEVLSICVRKRNDKRITQYDFNHAVANLNLEIIDATSDFKTISIPNSLIWASLNLIDKHSINSVDAMVLRSALDVAIELHNTSGDKLVLVASDQRLLRAARDEGLLVFNPETDPEQVLRKWV